MKGALSTSEMPIIAQVDALKLVFNHDSLYFTKHLTLQCFWKDPFPCCLNFPFPSYFIFKNV